MPHYIAFLRALNVGGRFIKMEALAKYFRALGHADVETFINSGNVIFSSPKKSSSALAASIDTGLEPLLGYKADAFVRSESEVHAIAKQAATFEPRVPAPGEVNVAFLARPLSLKQITVLQSLRSELDDFVCDGTEVYWLCGCRQSESKFSNAVFERKLATRTTIRRANMVARLAALLHMGAIGTR